MRVCLAGLLQRKAKAIDEIEAIYQKAVNDECRALTATELSRVEELKAQVSALKNEYEKGLAVERQMAATAVPIRP